VSRPLGSTHPDAKRKALVIRARVEDLERWHLAAELEGSPLSALARELLDVWADGVIARHLSP
jgi:hypothetical protein